MIVCIDIYRGNWNWYTCWNILYNHCTAVLLIVNNNIIRKALLILLIE